jgi:hypothetical protein
MTDNARHVPGSTRSCRIPLSRSTNSTRRFLSIPKKSVQIRPFCEYEFFIRSASTSYNLNALSVRIFLRRAPVAAELTRRTYLVHLAATGTLFLTPCPAHSLTFPLSHLQRCSPSHANQLYNTVQIRTFPDDFRFFWKRNTLYQQLTTTLSPVVRFWTSELLWGLEIGPWGFGGELCQSCAVPMPLSRRAADSCSFVSGPGLNQNEIK